MIVMHAGMPKAGSTTVQDWLVANVERLREGGFALLVAPRDDERRIRFQVYESGQLNSGWTVQAIAARGGADGRAEAIEEFVEALADAANRHGDVVLSGEFLAHPFWSLHRQALAGLERLARCYGLRVAYYVRPQHTALEAAWRQFGWHLPRVRPVDFVTQRAIWLHYAETRAGVRSIAPAIEFEPRPLREDLLDDGDLVADFAGRFLGIEARGSGARSNRGLPLATAVALRAAPEGVFPAGGFEPEWLSRLKRLLADRPPPEDDRIALSRQVLRKYAHETFAAENAELGWPDFVPPPDEADAIPGLEALDELWSPRGSLSAALRITRRRRAAHVSFARPGGSQ